MPNRPHICPDSVVTVNSLHAYLVGQLAAGKMANPNLVHQDNAKWVSSILEKADLLEAAERERA